MKEVHGRSRDTIAKLLAVELRDRNDIPEDKIADIMHECLELGGKTLLGELKKNKKKMLRDHAKCRRAFQQRLRKIWRKPLGLYETCLVIAQEMGGQFNSDHRPGSASANDLVFEVMTRLHGRVCHLASEVLHLMSGGYASGAMTRWRAMHEAVVVMAFIQKHGQDSAERYLLHEHIEGAKAAKEYIKHCGPNGEVTPAMLAENEKIRDELIVRYGKPYGKDYGWAAANLPEGVRPSIPAMEQQVDLEKVRPYYRLASHATHANPKSVLFNLEQGPKPEMILVGAANTGLADPGAQSLRHLMFATAILVGMHSDEETVMGSLALGDLVEEGVQAFMEVHHKVEAITKKQLKRRRRQV